MTFLKGRILSRIVALLLLTLTASPSIFAAELPGSAKVELAGFTAAETGARQTAAQSNVAAKNAVVSTTPQESPVYDPSGKLVGKKIVYANGTVENYNAAGNLTLVVFADKSYKQYAYTATGKISSIAWNRANGSRIELRCYFYDAVNNPTHQVVVSYDSVGAMTGAVRTCANGTTDYYDSKNRLVASYLKDGSYYTYGNYYANGRFGIMRSYALSNGTPKLAREVTYFDDGRRDTFSCYDAGVFVYSDKRIYDSNKKLTGFKRTTANGSIEYYDTYLRRVG